MKRTVFSISALLGVLLFAPHAPAQQVNDHAYELVVENACIPDSLAEFDQPSLVSGLDFDQLELVRIQLLERGFDPGFDANRDNTIDAQLMEALAEFQASNELPVTGTTDIPTLVALSFPIQQLR
jgi:peptidoglycan hydrolase-like protein with peptidoglycan-binding domain